MKFVNSSRSRRQTSEKEIEFVQERKNWKFVGYGVRLGEERGDNQQIVGFLGAKNTRPNEENKGSILYMGEDPCDRFVDWSILLFEHVKTLAELRGSFLSLHLLSFPLLRYSEFLIIHYPWVGKLLFVCFAFLPFRFVSFRFSCFLTSSIFWRGSPHYPLQNVLQ